MPQQGRPNIAGTIVKHNEFAETRQIVFMRNREGHWQKGLYRRVATVIGQHIHIRVSHQGAG